MSPTIPRRLGRYEVTGLLGTGAFATVFRARDDRLDADVAIKVLAENHSFDPDLRERFITEGQLLRRVDSPHVVKVFDLGETDAGQPFLVLDLAAGGDLAARRRSLEGSPGLLDVLAVGEQVAAALSALHAERVVHRDVTPGNLLIRGRATDRQPSVLLGAGERLLLADLGLSKDLAAASGLTKGAGTAGFTPPEQGGGGWVDPRADIWSASALLVWLVVGAPPDPAGAWRAELTGRGWPVGLADELERGLASEPADRHPTAASWLEALQQRRAAQPPAPPPPDDAVAAPLAPPGEPARPARRRRRTAAAFAALLASVLLLAAGWWLGRLSGEGAPTYGQTRIERLAGGQVRASAHRGGARVAITGPDALRVGQRAAYTAATSGVVRHEWLAPDGRAFEGEPALSVEPASDGSARIRLLGQTANGDVVVADLRVTVRAGA